ncbi:hypothetical protein LIER_40546 [Lithospermum erythrorhizon]|uniref:Uncharacterized protein n=1 Tax=Lithospermum erythrorhizon TaxID=34254 RepID=A0AAV3QXP0_LITER
MASSVIETSVVDNSTIDASNISAANVSMVDSVVVSTITNVGQSSGGSTFPPGFGSGPILPPRNFNVPMEVSNSKAKPETFSGKNFKRWMEQMIYESIKILDREGS